MNYYSTFIIRNNIIAQSNSELLYQNLLTAKMISTSHLLVV